MENDRVVVFIPVRKGMMEQMKTFYGDVLGFNIDGSEFIVNNIASIRGQLQYSQVNIDPQKNPIFEFSIRSDFPDYCTSLRRRGAKFEFVAMTPGGYMAKVFDPCGNSMMIRCDSFESSGNAELSSWEEYRRY